MLFNRNKYQQHFNIPGATATADLRVTSLQTPKSDETCDGSSSLFARKKNETGGTFFMNSACLLALAEAFLRFFAPLNIAGFVYHRCHAIYRKCEE